MSFINTHYPKICSNKTFRIFSGWGITDKYTWKENEDFVFVSSSLGEKVKSSQINVNLTKDFIKVDKKDCNIPIIEGKTRGMVDVDNSFWTLEEDNGVSELKITIKKSQSFNHDWFGVVLNENIQVKDYSPTSESNQNLNPNSLDPNEVYCKKYFPNIDHNKLSEMFLGWIERYADDMVPFGKPKTDIEFKFLSDNSGNKLMFADLDPAEYINVIIQSAENDPKSSELVFLNGPKTGIMKGNYGNDLKNKLVRSLNILIARFEIDVNNINTLEKTRKTASKFDYSGSEATLSPDNLENYINYHKSLESLMKGNATEDNKITGKIESKSDNGNKHAKKNPELENIMKKFTDIINVTEKKHPREQIKGIINNLKKNLCLDSAQVNNLMNHALDRVDKQVEESKERESKIAKTRSTDSWFQTQMEPQTIIERTADPFYSIMNNPANMENSLLVRKYHSITKTQQLKLRERWNNNAKRLELLISELFHSPSELVSTICDNYRDLLISEDYPTLMKSYLIQNGVRDDHERERLNFLNEFVLGLYKDAEIHTCKDEQYQLAKIKQICQWAINDFENINDLVRENKHLYDVNFMSYIKLLISKETKLMENDGEFPTPDKKPWLSILTIIEIAIKSMIHSEMEEDIYLISTIVSMKIPKVRKHMIEFILATMPRSDWKFFKDLVFSITNGLTNIPPEEREMGTIPKWVPEACFQLREDIESMIPDWIIDELLSESDKYIMAENNKKKSPVLRLDLSDKYNIAGKEEQRLTPEKIKAH